MFEQQYDESSSENESDVSDDEYTSLNPELLGLEDESTQAIQTSVDEFATFSKLTKHILSNDAFYEMCQQLNQKQRDIFNALINHIQNIKHRDIEPNPLHVFITGGGGVGKSFLIKAFSEYAYRQLKFPKQNIVDQPSILLTASTGTAASGINGTTLHSALHIPVKQRNSSISDKELPAIRNKYKFLKIIVIDEISMINYKIFEKFHLNLCKIKESDQPFGGVSVIAVGDLFQLPPVAPDLIYASRVGTLSALSPHLWKQYFRVFELQEIVCQANDTK